MLLMLRRDVLGESRGRRQRILGIMGRSGRRRGIVLLMRLRSTAEGLQGGASFGDRRERRRIREVVVSRPGGFRSIRRGCCGGRREEKGGKGGGEGGEERRRSRRYSSFVFFFVRFSEQRRIEYERRTRRSRIRRGILSSSLQRCESGRCARTVVTRELKGAAEPVSEISQLVSTLRRSTLASGMAHQSSSSWVTSNSSEIGPSGVPILAATIDVQLGRSSSRRTR